MLPPDKVILYALRANQARASATALRSMSSDKEIQIASLLLTYAIELDMVAEKWRTETDPNL